MEIKPTKIHDVLTINPRIFGDDRGFFMETYHARVFASNGIDAFFVQDNHSGSKKQTLRGLHYQIRYAQGKLVRVVSGEIFDVAVDLRRSSPYFGQWVGYILSAENRIQIWIPPGFAHGFYVLSDWAEVIYKATEFYAPEWERTLLWNDEDLGIKWPLIDFEPPIVSEKDARGTPMRLAETYI
jgi:dTDP-4-dehydrorhamnose 3,5-epimerase